MPDAHGDQNRALDPLEVELQMATSQHCGCKEIKSQSSGGVVSDLSCGPSLQPESFQGASGSIALISTWDTTIFTGESIVILESWVKNLGSLEATTALLQIVQVSIGFTSTAHGTDE